jgi:hypothetical protein
MTEGNYVQSNILLEMCEERKRQDKLHGDGELQSHHPVEWLIILEEEIGEIARAANEAYWLNGKAVGDFSNYRKEIVHAAAVLLAMAEDYDRNRSIEEGERENDR